MRLDRLRKSSDPPGQFNLIGSSEFLNSETKCNSPVKLADFRSAGRTRRFQQLQIALQIAGAACNGPSGGAAEDQYRAVCARSDRRLADATWRCRRDYRMRRVAVDRCSARWRVGQEGRRVLRGYSKAFTGTCYDTEAIGGRCLENSKVTLEHEVKDALSNAIGGDRSSRKSLGA
jgi:hypothetical protein